MPVASSFRRYRCSSRWVRERYAVVHLSPSRSAMSVARIGRSATTSRIAIARPTPWSAAYGRLFAGRWRGGGVPRGTAPLPVESGGIAELIIRASPDLLDLGHVLLVDQ